MFIGFLRTTTFALQNVSRNLWLSVITVFLLVLTLLSITLVVSLNILGTQAISAVRDKVDINLYFYTSVPQEEVLQAQGFLQQLPEVSDVVYVSPEEALTRFKEVHKDDPELIASVEQLDENVLPPSLIVRAKQIDQYPAIMSRFEKSDFVDLVDKADLNDNQDVITTISRITSKAYQIGIGVSLIFIVISIIVIFNAMRITIYSHREEVGIMRLVGATNWFIRAPFVLEGMLLGMISAVITLAVFTVLLTLSDPAVRTFFTGYDFSLLSFYSSHVVQFVLAELLLAIVLSTVSSMIAMTRYLKV